MAAQQRDKRAGILLVGSSIFGMWDAFAQHLAPLPVANVGINGSCTADQNGLIGPLVLPRRPRIVVYYCGSNDISCGCSPEYVSQSFIEFSTRLRQSLPGVRIVYLGVLKCADKYGKFDAIDSVNGTVKEFCDATSNHYFVDINPQLLRSDGRTVKTELFEADNLHLLPSTYAAIVTPALKSILTELWQSISAAP